MIWRVYHGADERRFRSFEAAERWARKAVASLDERGFSESATIRTWELGDAAEVRMSGDGRVWTDLKSDLIPLTTPLPTAATITLSH